MRCIRQDEFHGQTRLARTRGRFGNATQGLITSLSLVHAHASTLEYEASAQTATAAQHKIASVMAHQTSKAFYKRTITITSTHTALHTLHNSSERITWYRWRSCSELVVMALYVLLVYVAAVAISRLQLDTRIAFSSFFFFVCFRYAFDGSSIFTHRQCNRHDQQTYACVCTHVA